LCSTLFPEKSSSSGGIILWLITIIVIFVFVILFSGIVFCVKKTEKAFLQIAAKESMKHLLLRAFVPSWFN